MTSLFSHAPEPDEPAASAVDVPPVSLERRVPRGLHEAFNGFTEYIHLWWPESFSETGEGMFPEFEGGELIETSASGERILWATVHHREQDRSLELQWVLGHSQRTPSTLEVRFEQVPGAEEETTRVTLIHEGWGGQQDPGETRVQFEQSWTEVMDRYARFMGAR